MIFICNNLRDGMIPNDEAITLRSKSKIPNKLIGRVEGKNLKKKQK